MIPNLSLLNIASSPPSGGTRTQHGTPSTIPTVMSPEARGELIDNGTSIPKFELNKSIANISGRRNLAVTPITIPSQLSPIAPDFTPRARTAFVDPAYHGRSQVVSNFNAFPRVSSLLPGSLPDTAQASTPGGMDLTKSQQDLGVIGTGPRNITAGTLSHPIRFGIFTIDDVCTRAFVVTEVPVGIMSTLYELVAHSYKNFGSLANVNASKLNLGIFSVEFYDHAEAKQALYLTGDFIFPPGVKFYKLFPKDVAISSGVSSDSVTNHAAEFVVSVVDVGNSVGNIGSKDVFDACLALGAVKAFHTIEPIQNALGSFRVEWSDSRVNATKLSAASLKGYRIGIVANTPDVVQPVSVPLTRQALPAYDIERHTKNVMSFLMPETPSRGHVNIQHNVVDITKILLGQDVRTTIMLRNIPNRVDQPTLKELLDTTSRGKYDFMYLRIDFANNCNVGYAFINFVDPLAIVPFAKARAGQKWNLFGSNKVAEISYATIQGKDCLVQKFRNSSVMLERPDFRPKLFKTGNGLDAGEEEDFPDSDNQAKLKRSCDNAEQVGLYHPEISYSSPGNTPLLYDDHIPPPRNQKTGGVYAKPAYDRGAIYVNNVMGGDNGKPSGSGNFHFTPIIPTPPNCLYAPREGQAYRERQRRQFSQFDRGTPGAESELAANPSQMYTTLHRNDTESSYGGATSESAFHANGSYTPTPGGFNGLVATREPRSNVPSNGHASSSMSDGFTRSMRYGHH